MSVVANAVLVKITGAGDPDRYGDPSEEGPVLWQGRAHGYLRRFDRNLVRDGGQVAYQADVFTILSAAGAPLLEVPGPDWEATTITIEDRRVPRSPKLLTFRVNALENRAAGTSVDSVRLELEEVG